MKVQRYSVSRQKACHQCSISKSKLLDFSELKLTSSINVENISNRWLRAFIPLPEQAAKDYPAAVQGFIHRIVKSYVSASIRGRCPPFVHSSQVAAHSIRPPLSTCLSLVRICDKLLPGSEQTAANVLQREMRNIHGQHNAYDAPTLLSAFQAYLILAMALFFRLRSASGTFLREAVMSLQDLACSSAKMGLLCEAEQNSHRPRWESWIIAESNRRTLYTMYLFDNLLSANDGLPTFLGTELKGLPAPSNHALWRAPTRNIWEVAYNTHLAEWAEGLRIDELWPIPDDFDETQINNRRDRVDHWLEGVDEFGTMIYAVTSCTHASTNHAPPYSIFDRRQKALIVTLASTAASFSGLASNIYFPALPAVAADLNVSVELINLTVTSYLIFQGLAPSLWGPLSDVKGRRVTYCCTFLVFLGACVGLAETRNYATVIILRSLQSSGSASTIAVGAAVIEDITTREERGGYMGIFTAGLLIPNVIGPVIGGALAGSLGWRSIFWFLTIYSGAFLLFLLLLLPETLRAIVGDGSLGNAGIFVKYPLAVYQKTTKVNFTQLSEPPLTTLKAKIDILGPLRILFSKQAAPLIGFLGVYYAVWQMSITAMSTLFESQYGLGTSQIGLTFIANGSGAIVGTLVTGKLLDADYRRVQAANKVEEPGAELEMANGRNREIVSPPQGNQPDGLELPLEKARLRLLPLFALLQCAAIIVFGWTIQYTVHIAVPIVTTFITGWTLVSTQSAVSTYLVDVFPEHKASATASLDLARCLLAAGGTSLVIPLVNAVGAGWTFTITVAVQIIAGVGLLVQWRYGGKWRREADRRGKARV
ncbi:MFS general substrate transporter [Xylariaceae sp. FL1019]|nr:MFS general substrate transporter [Xylariaceae sp. FL1019]